MKRTVLCILLLCAFLSATAQEKKPMTHEDLWLLKRVGAPAVSPDGQWVVFGVAEPSYEEKEQVNDLWMVPTDGSAAPRKITAGKAAESGYAWSPDGRHLAFAAKRDGEEEAQIYLLNVREGGEAQRLTNLSTGAAAPKWSPDGKMLLFTSQVFSQVYVDSLNKKMNEEKKKLKYKARVYTSFPIRSWDKWLDEKQTHAFVQAVEPESKARDIFTDVAISKLDGFSFSGASWSSDSRDIVFAASVDANTAAYQSPATHLYRVPASGGDAAQLTNDKNDYGQPLLTPDGKYLLCQLSGNNDQKIYRLGRLARFDWPSMQDKVLLSTKIDRPINNFVVQGGQLYLSVEDQGRDQVYTMPLSGGEPKLVTTGPSGCYTNLHAAAQGQPMLVANYESPVMPAEVVRLQADGSHTLLTRFNMDKLSKLDMPPVETVWFTSSRGKQIRSLLVRPAGFDPAKKYPLFVVMHGGPASSAKENWSYRWNYHLLAQPGYVLLFTDYTGSTGYGEKFAQDIQYDPLKGPAQEINEAAADAIKRFAFIDATRQAAGGASYGGHLANWLQASTTHYKCLISHAGMVNSISQWGTSDNIYEREVMNGGAPWTLTKTWKEQNPQLYAANFKTPMLVTVGELDYRVPLNNSIENWHILQRQRVPSKLIVFPDENHWILKAENSRFFYKEVHAWLNQYLSGVDKG